jgi:hypothetical protein
MVCLEKLSVLLNSLSETSFFNPYLSYYKINLKNIIIFGFFIFFLDSFLAIFSRF